MRLLSIFCVCAIALANCADPTEGKPEAEVGEIIVEEPAAPVATSPSDDKSTVVVEPPATQTPAAEAAAEADPFSQPREGSRAKDALGLEGTVYRMAENSGIQFEGSKVTGTHVGGFSKYDGMVVVPDGKIEEAATIDIIIDMTSVFSDAGGLTEKLRGEEFFDVEKFPTASFRSTAITKTDAGYEVTGNFNLHGVTRSIKFPAGIGFEGETLTAQSEFVIKQFDWGIKYRGLGEDLIRDEVLILLDIEASAEGA
jgi:polyisoprenoid-binding protein YceI